MSEFKFACPVCGQHITSDSSHTGGQIECPTCYQKIVVPQAPTMADPKFILAASQVSKPRPTQNGLTPGPATEKTPANKVLPFIAGSFVVLLLAAGAAAFFLRDKLFKKPVPVAQVKTNAVAKKALAPPKVYPVPTNINWTLDLAEATPLEEKAVGKIHGSGFRCEKAILQGGVLTLRQGKGGAPDLGVSIHFFATTGEELSGKSVEVASDRTPPVPKIVLRWKDEQLQAKTRNLNDGYALKVEFGDADEGKIPGRIYLGLPDEEKSFVAGTFVAEIRKPAPPKPKQPKTPKPKTPPKAKA